MAAGDPPRKHMGGSAQKSGKSRKAKREDPIEAAHLHASCVAWHSQAVLITGASGSGKSALALELMAFGATLVADDRTDIQRRGVQLIASCPTVLCGKIEARFAGILRAEAAPPTEIVLAVDLDHVETQRMPPPRSMHLLGLEIPLYHKIERAHFAPTLLQYLKSGPEKS
ncbi:MAG: HPr kinase/phosphatase C-terminal domain-containing protein [Pseudomonadota bacterium]